MAEAPQPSYNHYASPAAGPLGLEPAVAHAPGEILKWIYFGFAAAGSVTLAALRFPPRLGPSTGSILAFAELAHRVFGWGRMLMALAWIHQAWAGVPRGQVGSVTPSRAVARLFIPIYNIYWLFAVNTNLCRVLDHILVDAHDTCRAPSTLRWLAPSFYLAGGVGFVLLLDSSFTWVALVLSATSDAMWLIYMFRCDVARRAVAQLGTR
jgi:hypothetical protein